MNAEGLSVDISIESGAFRRSIKFLAPCGITALIGPSGSGKTTTLNCVAGLLKPASGSISFNGNLWFDAQRGINIRAQQRRPGYVFQNSALFPHLTVANNILFGLNGSLEQVEKQTRLQDLANSFDLSDLLERKPSQLSGGQSQKVALARALAPSPQLLLLDEPLNALDRNARDNIAAKLKAVQAERRLVVVFVTHFLDETAAFADFVVDIDPAV